MIKNIIFLLIGAYLFLFVGPTVVSFFVVFRKIKNKDLKHLNVDAPYYAKYKDELISARSFYDGLSKQEISIKSYDGIDLYATYIKNNSKDVVVMVHGYIAYKEDHFLLQIKDFINNNYNVLLLSMRGHDNHLEDRCYLGLKEQYDILSWIEYLSKEEENIILYGLSMGASSIGYASNKIENDKVKCLILDSGFSSVYDQLAYDSRKRYIPWFITMPVMTVLCKLILKIDIKTKVGSSLKDNKVPTLFIHGTKDLTVPISQGLENYNNNGSIKKFIKVDGAVHMSSYLQDKEIKNEITNFIKEAKK